MGGHSIEISASIIEGARGGSHVNTVPSYLDGLPFAQDKHVQHVHVRILLEDVGLGVMLEVTVVPPVGGGSLWGKKWG